ncbi:Protein fem-1 homolog B [Gryllus bimaculatus]|nr:Protein fem-1 homolog B [Gryllus bimaculatus]
MCGVVAVGGARRVNDGRRSRASRVAGRRRSPRRTVRLLKRDAPPLGRRLLQLQLRTRAAAARRQPQRVRQKRRDAAAQSGGARQRVRAVAAAAPRRRERGRALLPPGDGPAPRRPRRPRPLRRGLRPLHYAATTGNYKSIRLLADCGADINARTGNGNTALHIASSRDSPTCVEELVRHGADLHAPDKRGLTPLHVAAAHGRVEVLRELLRLGARTDLRAQQITPLMIAVERRDEECGRALIEAGADVSGGTLLGYLNLLSHRESPQNTQEDQNDNLLSST